MIRLPAEAAGLHFEQDRETGQRLDDALRDTASATPESLPLLEHVLSLLYDQQSTRGDDLLRWSDYRELGELKGALTEVGYVDLWRWFFCCTRMSSGSTFQQFNHSLGIGASNHVDGDFNRALAIRKRPVSHPTRDERSIGHDCAGFPMKCGYPDQRRHGRLFGQLGGRARQASGLMRKTSIRQSSAVSAV